jgi:GNAT superfamily N-acetyltransferase
MSDIRYQELLASHITPQVMDNLNHLLKQLSSNAEPVTEEWMAYLFASGTRVFAAFDGEQIVGVVLRAVMVILAGQKDWIEDVVVDDDYRRQGIASDLMDIAEEACRAGKAKSINLTSKLERFGARTMYGDRGYEIRPTNVFRLKLR